MTINKVAVIGLGSIGRRHLRIISEIRPDIKIIVVRSGKGATCSEESIATKIVYSVADAIQCGVQAAIVSSPATLHLEQAKELAKNNVHLLIEKPLSSVSDGIDQLSKTVINNKIVAIIGYAFRYDKGAIKFKEWLSNKIVGKILHARIECGSYLPDWRPGQDYRKTVSALRELGGGVLLELSHEIDYLYWFFGRPVDVVAKIRNSNTLDVNVEDQADLLLTSQDGYPISVQLDFARRNNVRICKVLTTEGELVWDAINRTVTLRAVNNEPEIYTYKNDKDYIYRQQMESFFECIDQDIEPTVSVLDGLDVMKLIDAARLAADKGCKIEL